MKENCENTESQNQIYSHTRRAFIKSSAGVVSALGWLGASSAIAQSNNAGLDWALHEWNPDKPFLVCGKPLRVQPVLMYTVANPRKARSWKSWGGVLDDNTASEELKRISRELELLTERAEFSLEFLNPVKVKTVEEANQIHQNEYDVVLVFPASGSGRLLQACVSQNKDAVIFVRHRSGPLYYWYEALSVAYLQSGRTTGNNTSPRLENAHVDDVVVDDYDDVLWRLRALYGIHNLQGARIIALGGVWGKYASDAPQIAREKYKLEIIEIDYGDFEGRIQQAFQETERLTRAKEWTKKYLAMPGTELKTEKTFVVNAFVLYELFKELMHEYQAPAFTIKNCMSTIIPMAKTTACLSLSLLNDEGLLAFCESDFVVIPAGILLRHITGKPVFLHNSTFPHKGIVTCAHCSAPRRMDARSYESSKILTHEESDYGAAPKVEIPIGREVSFIDPEYTVGRWVGMRGNVEDNPFYPICRSQQDVRIQGDWEKLIDEVRDSHWLMVYGDYLKEIGYAARKMGIKWDNISDV